jgi:CBS domain containing-hemolysin-like protein
MAGHVPAAGDVLVHPNGWRLEIVASDGRRIERLRLVPPGESADEATG